MSVVDCPFPFAGVEVWLAEGSLSLLIIDLSRVLRAKTDSGQVLNKHLSKAWILNYEAVIDSDD